jgi:penicillin-binding protein 2
MWAGGQPDVFSEKRFRDRVRFISVVFAVAYSLIGVRLFYLQVIKGDALSQLSESNRTQLIFFRAPRGDIYDRKGRLLVTNRPSWSLMYSVPQKSVADRERVTALLEPFMKKFPQKQWNARLQRAFKSKQMVRLAEDVPDDISFGLQELGELVPGLQVVMEFRRGYLSESSAGHVLGYLGEINDRELRDDQWADRKLGDLIGKMGVEKVLDRDLRGTDGGMLIEVDSIGRLKRVIRELPSEKGKSVQLTIDLDIQRAAREALEATPTKRGAAVAFDVNTGAILGWVSAPSFDPSGSLAEDVTDPNLPFFDRVYKGAYPPGSVYKLMTAVAALENRNVNFSERVTCIGYMSLFDKKNVEKRYGCWKVHGSVDFWEAVAHSCNCYFYTIGPRVGPEIIQKISQSFGLGESAQKIFPGENIGTIPSPAWKKRKGLGGWSTGDTFNMSIGQGFVTSTPIQIAIMTMGMANHGTIWSPYLVDKMVDSSGKVVYQSAKTVRREISLKESTWDVMDRAMRGVVVGGTGGATNIPYLDVRGKSGTAQNPHGETHAWFVAFAGYPGEKPSVAVCVFVENGGGGGGVAAPVVRKILEAALPAKPVGSI